MWLAEKCLKLLADDQGLKQLATQLKMSDKILDFGTCD